MYLNYFSKQLILKLTDFLKEIKILRVLDKNTINNELFVYKKKNPSQNEDTQSITPGMDWNDLLKVTFYFEQIYNF